MRRYEQVRAKKKLAGRFGIGVDRMMIGRCIRKLQEQWPQHGKPGARSLIGERIEIGHEPIASLDKAAADGLLFRASDPWFLIAASFLSVIALDGLERGYFKPFCQ